MDKSFSVGPLEPLTFGDEGLGASAFLPALGEATPSPSEFTSLSQGGGPPDCSASFYGGPPTSGALSYSGWGAPPSQSFLVPSSPASQVQSTPSGGLQGAPPRDPSSSEVGNGIFLCDRIVLEYSGDCQLPAEVRLALKHPHGYKLKGSQRGASSKQTNHIPGVAGRGSIVFKHGMGEETAEGKGEFPGAPGIAAAPCKCSDCGRCRAVAEARSILSPFGLHLRLSAPHADGGAPPGLLSRSPSRRVDPRSRKGAEEQQGAPVSLALACVPAGGVGSLTSSGGDPQGAPGAPGNCICALLSAEGGRVGVAGQLVSQALTAKEKAAVEAAAAIKRALSYFLLEAPQPAGAAVVRVGPSRAPGQNDAEGSLQHHAKAGPLAAVKLLTQQQQQQQQGSSSSRDPRSSSSSNSSSSSSSTKSSGPGERRPTDSQGALIGGLLDAIIQLHDVSSLENQAAVCSNHFSALLSNKRAIITSTSKAFQSFLLQHEEALKAEFPRGATLARHQQQEARRRLALASGGPLGGPSARGGPPEEEEEGKAINSALQLGPNFSLHCFVFEGQRQARALLKLLKAFVSLHAHVGAPHAGASGGPSTFNSFVAAAAAHSSAEAKALHRMGRKAFGAPLQVCFVVSNFRIVGARVTDARVSFTDLAVSNQGGLTIATKRLRIRGLLLPQSQKELLNAVHALEASGALAGCSLFWGFTRQPHGGAPFYNQGLALCFPGERVWRQFKQFGGALALERPPTFGLLRALVPEMVWGLAARRQREAQQLQQDEEAARAAAAAAAALGSQQQPLLALTDGSDVQGVEALKDASFFYCWLAELREQLPPQLRRRCLTERKALHALLAARRRCGKELEAAAPEAPGGPSRPVGEQTVPVGEETVSVGEKTISVGEKTISVSCMRLCVPLTSHRFAADRKEQAQLLQHVPVESLVSSVYFRFLAKHGAPPPLDADLAPPLRPSWIRSLAALRAKAKKAGSHQTLQNNDSTNTNTDGTQANNKQQTETLVCLLAGEAENASVFGKDGLVSSLCSLLRFSLEEAALTRRSSSCLSASNALAAARRYCTSAQGGPPGAPSNGPSGSQPAEATGFVGPLVMYVILLVGPDKSCQVAEEMRLFLQLQRETPNDKLQLHFVAPGWAYHCLHQGMLNPVSSLPYHVQLEGLPPCCMPPGTAPNDEASRDSIVPFGAIGGPPIPERLQLVLRHQSHIKEPWGLPLFGWHLLTTETDFASLGVSRDELETLWGVFVVFVSSLSPQSVLRGLLSLLSSLGLDASAAPADMRQLPLFAAVLIPHTTTPEEAAECLGGPQEGLLQASPTHELTRGPSSPRKAHHSLQGALGPFTPRKSSSKFLTLSPRLSPSAARSPLKDSGAPPWPITAASPQRPSRQGALSFSSTLTGGPPRGTPKKRLAGTSPLSNRGPQGSNPLRSAARRGASQASSGRDAGGLSSPLRAILRPSLRVGPPTGCRANLALYQRGPYGHSKAEPPRFCVKSGTYRLMVGRMRVFVPGLEGVPLLRGPWLLECLRMRRLLPMQQFMVPFKQQQQQQQQQQHQPCGLSGGLAEEALSIQRKRVRGEAALQTPKKRKPQGGPPFEGPPASPLGKGILAAPHTPNRLSAAAANELEKLSPSRLPAAPTAGVGAPTAGPTSAPTEEPGALSTSKENLSPSLIPRSRLSCAPEEVPQSVSSPTDVCTPQQTRTRRNKTTPKEGQKQQQQQQQQQRERGGGKLTVKKGRRS